MTLAAPVAIRVNPNDSTQYYVLWGNGRVDAIGGAAPITSGPTWYNRTDQPVAVDIHVRDWATGKAQIMDFQGAFHPLNGDTNYMDNSDAANPVNTLGLVYTPNRRYVRFFWDPSQPAQGYALDGYGQWFPFGGATVPPRGGPRFTTWAVRGADFSFAGGVKKAYMVDMSGAVWPDFSAVTPPIAAPYYTGQDVARDLDITDWTNGRGYTLTGDGAVHAFGGATASGVAGPYRAGRDVARILYVLSASDPVKLRQIQSGGELFEYYNSTPPTVTAGGGQSDVQKVTITGTPTGGTFTLTYSGQTTAAIAYNATAATVQTALRALSNIGSTGVNVTGGPGPGTAWTATFAGSLALQDVPQMTATSSLTGGTTPAVTVSTTTPGIASSPALSTTDTTRPVLSWVYSDPEKDSQAAWQLYVYTAAWVSGHTMTDPSVWASSAVVAQSGINPTTRGITSPVDLVNGGYTMYVRAQDTAGNWSGWASFAWTQSITPPATPTGLTATADNTAKRVNLSATTGGTGALIRFEYSDDSGTTWTAVRGADAVTRVATTTAVDLDPPQNQARMYRAIAYSTSPRTASPPSGTATATVTGTGYLLTAVNDSSLGVMPRVQEPVEWSRPVVAGVFQGLGAKFPTVLSDGVPKARRTNLNVLSLDRTTWNGLKALIEADSTLVLRDPFGEVMYCRVVGDWQRAQIILTPTSGETTAVRHSHEVTLPLVEVAPPQAVA